jgi:hypothetical protein
VDGDESSDTPEAGTSGRGEDERVAGDAYSKVLNFFRELTALHMAPKCGLSNGT